MGPRIREDTGGGWVPASVFARARSPCGGTGMGPRMREGVEGVGLPHVRGHGGLRQGDGRFANRPYGRRILSGTGFTPIPRLHEGRL